jgi:DNA-binding MarR family transcriptional regulator
VLVDGVGDGAVTSSTPQYTEIDLGWSLGAVLRSYLSAASGAVVDVPGRGRGYLVLDTAGRGEPKSQSALAQFLGVDRTVMTYLIDGLERAGLVERRPDPVDRRARRVVITENGRALLAEVRERLRQVEDEVLAALDESDRSTLRTLLHRVASAVAPEDKCLVVKTILESKAASARGR